MADFATSNRLGLAYVAETTPGTTPATPAFQNLRFTSESLNYNSEFTVSEEIRSDRMTPDTIQTASSAGGDISGEWSYGSYDDFIEGAMFEAWTAGVENLTTDDVALTKTGTGAAATWELTIPAGEAVFTGAIVGQYLRLFKDPGIAELFLEVLEVPGAGATTMDVRPLDDRATFASQDDVVARRLDYIRNGVADKPFTIQKSFNDLATIEYQNFTGARIGTWGLELATGSILTTSFGLLALDAAMTETQITGATFTDANVNDVLNAVDNVAAVVFDGNPAADQFFFNSLSLTFDNALRGLQAIGTLGFIGVEPGRITTTGSIELYFESSSLFDRFRAAQAFSLSFLAQDSDGNAYIVTLPRVKFTSLEIVAGGLDTDIFASAELQALIDDTGTFQIQVSRFTA